jgi:hypothetical protein
MLFIQIEQMRIYQILLMWILAWSSLWWGRQEMYGQQAEVQLEETGLWGGVYLRGMFSKKWGYYGEHHLRMRNSTEELWGFADRFRQIYNRFGISFQPHKNFEL